MAKFAKVVTGALTTSGTCDITSSGAGTCNGAIIYFTSATSANTDTNTAALATMVFDGTSCYTIAVTDADNSAKSNADDLIDDTLIGFSGSSSTDYATSVATITDGIRITWGDGPPAYRYTAILFFGGVSLKAGYIITSSTLNGTASYTSASFTPQAGLFSGIGGTNFNGTTYLDYAAADFSTGVFSYIDSTILQRTAYYRSTHNTNDATIITLARNDAVGSHGSVSPYYEITNVASDGFTITTRGSANGGTYIFLLIGGINTASLNDTACPASTGDKSWEGPGFQPDLIVMAQTALAAYNTQYTSEDGNLAIGAHDGTAGGGVAVWSLDGAATTDTGSRTNSTNFLQSYQTTASKQFAASFSSFDSLGYNLNYSEVSSGGIGFTLAIQFESTSTPITGYWAIDGTFNNAF